jgi:hypothetical protein
LWRGNVYQLVEEPMMRLQRSICKDRCCSPQVVQFSASGLQGMACRLLVPPVTQTRAVLKLTLGQVYSRLLLTPKQEGARSILKAGNCRSCGSMQQARYRWRDLPSMGCRLSRQATRPRHTCITPVHILQQYNTEFAFLPCFQSTLLPAAFDRTAVAEDVLVCHNV